MRAAIALSLLLCALLLPGLAHCKKGNSESKRRNKDEKGKGKKLYSCVNDGQWAFKIQTSKLQKSFFPVRCDFLNMSTNGASHSNNDNMTAVVELSMEGRVGQCAGLTADLLVQMNTCHWQTQCNITYKAGKHYMIKGPTGLPNVQCITQMPEHIYLHYTCAAPAVPILTLSPNQSESVKEKRGIIRSHAHQPWNYDDNLFKTSTLTLSYSSSNFPVLAYRIRSFDFGDEDELSITLANESRHIASFNMSNVNTTRTYNVSGGQPVTFKLKVRSHGRSGFVVCFQWVEKGTTISDACEGLIIPKTCETPNKSAKNGEKKKQQNGKGKKEKNRKNKKEKKNGKN